MADKRHADSTTDDGPAAKKANLEGDSSEGSGPDMQAGAPIYPVSRPFKGMNKTTVHFTKTFQFKIYNSDWQLIADDNGGVNLRGFMNTIPWDRLCMYLSPDEYQSVIKDCHYAKLVETGFQMCYLTTRTPFLANATDPAPANGNLDFSLVRWDGLEQMMPFTEWDYTEAGQTPIIRLSSQELIGRLYGIALSQLNDANSLGATMQQRGISTYPRWRFQSQATMTANGPSSALTPHGSLNNLVATLPVFEYKTDQISTLAQKNYCFNKTHKPKNGVLGFAPSIFTDTYRTPLGFAQINSKVPLSDSGLRTSNAVANNDPQFAQAFNNGAAPTVTVLRADAKPRGTIQEGGANTPWWLMTSDTPQAAGSAKPAKLWIRTPAGSTNAFFEGAENVVEVSAASNGTVPPTFGYGSLDTMKYYSVARIENYSLHTSRNDPPIHHLPSMMIGAIPKRNLDNTFIEGIHEFEIKTHCTVTLDSCHPLYYNLAQVAVTEPGFTIGQYIDPIVGPLGTPGIMGARWQNNETDVMLYDNKYAIPAYGRAAKMQFAGFESDAIPLITEKK